MNDALLVMKWPLVACLLLPGILVYFGLHIVRRGIIFVDLALAQVAALGMCLCLMLGHDPHDFHTYLWSLGFTLIGALIFTFTRTRENHRVPQEALIGIVYVVAAAAILLLSKSTAGNEELKNTLVGDVLNVSQSQVWQTFALFAVIAVIHLLFRKRFLALTFNATGATEPRARWWDFLFYATFGLVVTSFVQIGGVLLVFSYLVVPAVCANLLATSLGTMLAIGIAAAMLGGVGGLAVSYQFDLPTGAAIVCMLGLVLIIAAVVAKLRSSRSHTESEKAV